MGVPVVRPSNSPESKDTRRIPCGRWSAWIGLGAAGRVRAAAAPGLWPRQRASPSSDPAQRGAVGFAKGGELKRCPNGVAGHVCKGTGAAASRSVMCDLGAHGNGFAPGRMLIKDIGHLVGFGAKALGSLSGA